MNIEDMTGLLAECKLESERDSVLSNDNGVVDNQISEEITIKDIAERLDTLGAQMNWLCENLTQLFVFVQAMSGSGGGIRGLLKAMKSETPELLTQEGMPNAG